MPELFLITVTVSYLLTLAVLTMYFAKTTWFAQRKQAEMEASYNAYVLAQRTETQSLAHQALDTNVRSPSANPIYRMGEPLKWDQEGLMEGS